MPELSFLSHIARTIYGLEPVSIEALEPYCSEQRGLYRVQDAQQGMWMFRLWRSAGSKEPVLHAGQLLEWLRRQGYPAPCVRRTSDQQLVGIADNWTIIVLGYIDGTPLGTDPADLGIIARMLGRLHSLPGDEQLVGAKSRCHPDTISTVVQQLSTHREKVPKAFYSLVSHLYAAMTGLQRQSGLPLCITHGDCWHRNAIKTREGDIFLIDWDQSGIGLPLLDLGNLLLSSHFDFDRPLQVEADDNKIQAILHGYGQERPIPVQDSEHLANTMRFLLAWQLGSYMADDRLFLHPEFPFVLQKLQARFQATQEIADIAIDYLGNF